MSDGELKKRIREEAKDDYYFQVPEEDLIKWLDEAKKELENNVVTTLELWRKYQYCLPVDSAKQQWVPMSVVKKWFGEK